MWFSHQLQSPEVQLASAVSLSFTIFLEEIASQYPYARILAFKKWHSAESLVEKFNDKTRFFRILRWENGQILAYFESKQCWEVGKENVQVIQWFFVWWDVRRQWILRQIWEQFVEWCSINGYEYIWSMTTLQNHISQNVHRALFGPGTSQLIQSPDGHSYRYVLDLENRIEK